MIDPRVVDKLVETTPRGRLRALYEWLTGATSPQLAPAGVGKESAGPNPVRINPTRVPNQVRLAEHVTYENLSRPVLFCKWGRIRV